MIRVLVAEDSETARAVLVDLLGKDGEIEVVGQAHDGLEAVELFERLRPDLITMDVLMPRMDGFEATRKIMTLRPTPILIVSSLTDVSESEMVAYALAAGALSVLRKPSAPVTSEARRIAAEFVATVKTMSRVLIPRERDSRPAPMLALHPPAAPSAAAADASADAAGAEIVALSAAAGGPEALHSLLWALPENFPVPIVIVLVLTPGFIDGMAKFLARITKLRVKLAEEGEALRVGTVYMAPDDAHLGVAPGRTITLSRARKIGGLRPADSFLFASVAEALGPASVAVLLTGQGDGNLAGLRAIREAGGCILAQDEATSVVFGAAKAAAEAELVSETLPLRALPARLVELCRRRASR